jgi:ATP-binding cassette subfamily B protein
LVIKSPTIEFKNVHFGHDGKNSVVKGLNLTVQPGEKVGLVGHSGAGKSTLVNLLLRYFKNTRGEILIDHQNINQVTQDSLRENIAIVPQDTMLFHRTLMENIRYAKPDATDEEVIEASKHAHLHEFIMQLPEQYQSYVGERGIKLSGGQRQRIAIAWAILKDAPILILDEATSSLDSHTEKLIQESLNFLIEDKRKTVIAIAHRLSTLKHMDRIIVLDKGRIIEEGTHNELIHNDNSLYKKLWKLQEI